MQFLKDGMATGPNGHGRVLCQAVGGRRVTMVDGASADTASQILQ